MNRKEFIMAKKIVRVVGHKNPDTDSICAAIAYANLKSQIDDTVEYIPMRAGSVNAETAFVLDYFNNSITSSMYSASSNANHLCCIIAIHPCLIIMINYIIHRNSFHFILHKFSFT